MDSFQALLRLYLIAGGVVLGLMTLLWLVSLRLRDSSIVDIFWGTGFVVVNWAAFAAAGHAPDGRQWLLSALVTVWGLRLSLHILRRNWGRGEDFRYQKWRKEHGARWWWRSFFQVYLLQGVLLLIVAAPLVTTHAWGDRGGWPALALLAIPLWLVGFFFEAAGDWQLSRFIANPANKGKILSTGVWRYTRHPNYFGDSAQWWAYFLIAASFPFGAWTVFSPIVMTLLLVRVSGVALLERTMKETKPGYREYMERTSAFLPWFPRKPGDRPAAIVPRARK
jgi:steroid 5-alpha reductase family enzyme